MTDSITVKVQLLPKIKGMPDGGLAVPKLSVELLEEESQSSAWIAEIKVLGDLPWHQGEQCRVEKCS